MRYFAILLLLGLSPAVFAQIPVTVSMAGIGDIRVGMKKAELEKLLGQPVKLNKLLKKEDWDRDTLTVQYKDIPYQVVLDKNYVDEKNWDILVWEVRSSAPQLKTKSGIAIGDDKLKIVSTYEGYTIEITPEYENNFTVKSKTRSIVMLYGDESGTMIVFYLTNNRVTGFSVTYNEGC